jgi:hypothetical protein
LSDLKFQKQDCKPKEAERPQNAKKIFSQPTQQLLNITTFFNIRRPMLFVVLTASISQALSDNLLQHPSSDAFCCTDGIN